MDTKKLLALLLLVVLLGIGAHLFIVKKHHKHDTQRHDYKDQTEQTTETAPETDEEGGDGAETPAPTPTPSAPAASAPVTSEPPVSDPLPPAESGGIDDILSDFGEDDESYDDSGLDEDFSGNLDDGI